MKNYLKRERSTRKNINEPRANPEKFLFCNGFYNEQRADKEKIYFLHQSGEEPARIYKLNRRGTGENKNIGAAKFCFIAVL